MADPARDLNSGSTSPNNQPEQGELEIREHAPQITSVSVNGNSSGSAPGPNVAANDNAVANDNAGGGSATATGAQSASVSPAQSTSQQSPVNGSNVPSSAGAASSTAPETQTTEGQAVPAENTSEPGKEGEAKEEGKGDGKKENDGKEKEKEKGEEEEEKKDGKDTVGEKDDAKAEAQAQKPETELAQPKSEANQKDSQAQSNSQPGKEVAQPVQKPTWQPAPPNRLGQRNPLRSASAPRSGVPRPAAGPGGSVSNNRGDRGSATPSAGNAAQSAISRGAQKAYDSMHRMADEQRADEKSGKYEKNELTEGPDMKMKKGGFSAGASLQKANLEKQTAELAAKKVGSMAGGLGANKKQQELITINLIALINVIFLIIELLLIETVIAAFFLIFHIIIFIWWLLSKGRWKKAWLGTVAIFLMPFISIFALFAIWAMGTLAVGIIACHQMSQAIPFGIPIGYVTRIGSAFGANVGPFAQFCDFINVHSAGVGGTSHRATPTTNTPSTTHTVATIDGKVVLVDQAGQILTPVISDTQLVRPQPLASELIAQSNQAGYLSPASCKLGDIPYSEVVHTQRVQLDNGQSKLIAMPIHKTIDCIQNDPTKTAVRSVQIGKVVRRVENDRVLGNYITVEYPNGLRVSYYHLATMPELLSLGSIVNAGQPVGTMGQTGQITFTGTQMLFEYKDLHDAWVVFNPIQEDPQSSVLTLFPCAQPGNAGQKCLLD